MTIESETEVQYTWAARVEKKKVFFFEMTVLGAQFVDSDVQTHF